MTDLPDRRPRDYDDAGVKWKPFNAWCDYWGRPCPKSGECDCVVELIYREEDERDDE